MGGREKTRREEEVASDIPEHKSLQIALIVSEAKHAANKIVWQGIGWIVGGVVLTILTGGLLVFWGAPLYGLYLVVRGVYFRLLPHKLIQRAFANQTTEQEGN